MKELKFCRRYLKGFSQTVPALLPDAVALREGVRHVASLGVAQQIPQGRR